MTRLNFAIILLGMVMVTGCTQVQGGDATTTNGDATGGSVGDVESQPDLDVDLSVPGLGTQ